MNGTNSGFIGNGVEISGQDPSRDAPQLLQRAAGDDRAPRRDAQPFPGGRVGCYGAVHEATCLEVRRVIAAGGSSCWGQRITGTIRDPRVTATRRRLPQDRVCGDGSTRSSLRLREPGSQASRDEPGYRFGRLQAKVPASIVGLRNTSLHSRLSETDLSIEPVLRRQTKSHDP